MRMFKIISLLTICFSLLFGGVANAAMLCCMKAGDGAMSVTQNASSAMPCHKVAVKKMAKEYGSCKKCQHCVGINALITMPARHYTTGFSYVFHDAFRVSVTSYNVSAIYSPPRLFS